MFWRLLIFLIDSFDSFSYSLATCRSVRTRDSDSQHAYTPIKKILLLEATTATSPTSRTSPLLPSVVRVSTFDHDGRRQLSSLFCFFLSYKFYRNVRLFLFFGTQTC